MALVPAHMVPPALGGPAPLMEPVSSVDARHAEAFLQAMATTGAEREASQIMMRKFQLEVALRAMQTQRSVAAQKRRAMGMAPNGPTRAEAVTIRDLITFQQDPLPTSLLRMDKIHSEPAKLLFTEILSFMGLENGRTLNKDEERLLVSRVLALLGVHPPLRDEVFVQLQKQTRNNPYRGACAKAWELFRMCATVFPPTPVVAAPLTQYFEHLVNDSGLEPEIKDLVLATWTALDHAVKVGPRRIVPSADEVGAMVNRKALIVPVYLADESPENIPYDVSTTVAEAQGCVMKKIQIENDPSFGMFTYRISKNIGATPGEPIVEQILIQPNTYLGDVLADYVKQARTGLTTSKLLLKRRFFRPTDSASTNRMFLQLCYVQLRQDYTNGYYLVTDEGAIMLAALQILAEIGNVPDADTSLEWSIQLKKSIPKVMWRYKTKEQWTELVAAKYKSLWALDYEATMREFVHIILSLPSGGASFFTLKTVSDSAEFFPNRVIVGINRHGLHFLDAEVRSVIHAAELSEVSEYAGKVDRVFFSMMLKGALHSFEFATTGGDEMCLLLDHFISSQLQELQGL